MTDDDPYAFANDVETACTYAFQLAAACWMFYALGVMSQRLYTLLLGGLILILVVEIVEAVMKHDLEREHKYALAW